MMASTPGDPASATFSWWASSNRNARLIAPAVAPWASYWISPACRATRRRIRAASTWVALCSRTASANATDSRSTTLLFGISGGANTNTPSPRTARPRITIAILGTTESDAVSLVALFGGGLLGVGWVSIALFSVKERG
jgi:hypothetical protein